jgi:hypothetical protein
VPEHASHPTAASVTVWRLVQGTRCSFTATARWSEYYPGDAAGTMWRKMPHTMLAKCAEALALRKGFPRQLAGLYAKEELDQAGENGHGYVVTPVEAPTPPVTANPSGAREREKPSEPNGGETRPLSDLPDGAFVIAQVRPKSHGALKAAVDLVGAGGPMKDEYAVFVAKLAVLMEELCQNAVPVRVEFKTAKTSGKPYIVGVVRALRHEAPVEDVPVADEVPF